MFDFHTHDLSAPAGTAIVNLPREFLLHPAQFHPLPGALHSAGIHPWWIGDAAGLPQLQAGLHEVCRHPQVLRIGECGFDRLHGRPELQAAVFEEHVRLSEALQKPLTIHCVRAFDLLLAARKRLRPTQRWAVHGFRGRPALARQLLDAGFDLSFGLRFHPGSFRLTPPDRRFRETDAENQPSAEDPAGIPIVFQPSSL